MEILRNKKSKVELRLDSANCLIEVISIDVISSVRYFSMTHEDFIFMSHYIMDKEISVEGMRNNKPYDFNIRFSDDILYFEIDGKYEEFIISSSRFRRLLNTIVDSIISIHKRVYIVSSTDNISDDMFDDISNEKVKMVFADSLYQACSKLSINTLPIKIISLGEEQKKQLL